MTLADLIVAKRFNDVAEKGVEETVEDGFMLNTFVAEGLRDNWIRSGVVDLIDVEM